MPSKRIVLAYLANAHVWIDLLIRLQSGYRAYELPAQCRAYHAARRLLRLRFPSRIERYRLPIALESGLAEHFAQPG